MPYFILGPHQVTIGDRTFARIHGVRVETNTATFANKAVIMLPKARGLVNSNRPQDDIRAWLKVGAPVNITLNMTDSIKGILHTNTEFIGYVTRIQPGTPAEIECQDATWLLSRVEVNKTYKSTSVKAICADILKLVNNKFKTSLKLSPKIPNIPINELRISQADGLFAIDKLRDAYGLGAWFRGNELYVGLAYEAMPDTRAVNINLKKGIVTDQLVAVDAQDQRLVVIAKGINKKNQVISAQWPEQAGEFDRKITLVNTRARTREDLLDWARAKQREERFDGYTGEIITFFIPFIQAGDSVVVSDPDNLEQAGRYIAEEVTCEYIVGSGIRRTITGFAVSWQCERRYRKSAAIYWID